MTTLQDMVDKREIAYDRCDRYAKTCPCCGLDASRFVYACQTCFDKYWRELGEDRNTFNPTEARDAFYSLGVRLRAEGKMPALKEQKWGVWIPGHGWTLGTPYGSRGSAESSAKVSRERHGYKDAEVRPYPDAAACPECKASPCDCEQKIWTFWWWNPSAMSKPVHLNPGATRPVAAHTRQINLGDKSVLWGPVQRITDPPYRFEKEQPIITDGCPPPTQPGKWRVVSAGPVTVTPPKPENGRAAQGIRTFTQSELAREIFDTDKRARAFALTKAEHGADLPPAYVKTLFANRLNSVWRMMDIAWSRDEGGWRSEAEDIAKRVFE